MTADGKSAPRVLGGRRNEWASRVAVWTLGALAACSGKASHNANASNSPDSGDDSEEDAAPATETGDDGGDEGTTTTLGGNSNPDGVSYPTPTDGYGRAARSGPTPGSVIQNFKFLGYPNGVVQSALQRISLADYYDPCNKRYKLIHLTVAAVWCEPCNQETDAMVAAAGALASQNVVVVQALDDGQTVGVGATVTDLQKWIGNHKINFTDMLDPEPNDALGIFFNAAAVPWNADIDPRTMEILDSATGWAGDAQTEIQPGLDAVAQPPNYPLPVSCN